LTAADPARSRARDGAPEIDYGELHPVAFHVKELRGVFTECTGAYTNFNTECYYNN